MPQPLPEIYIVILHIHNRERKDFPSWCDACMLWERCLCSAEFRQRLESSVRRAAMCALVGAVGALVTTIPSHHLCHCAMVGEPHRTNQAGVRRPPSAVRARPRREGDRFDAVGIRPSSPSTCSCSLQAGRPARLIDSVAGSRAVARGSRARG